MPTLNQLISDIRNIADSGENNYSFRIEDDQIAYWIHQTRSMLISQAISKRDSITDSWIQSISCLELIQVDESECCDIPIGCSVLRTKNKIPNTIETSGDNLILKVTKVNGDVISKSSSFKSYYNKYNKYTKVPQWFLKNDYIYIINTLLLEYITVYALFEDPTSLADFKSCSDDKCYNSDANYPVSLKMANDITNYVLKAKVMPFLQLPQDTTNNSYSDNQLGGKAQL